VRGRPAPLPFVVRETPRARRTDAIPVLVHGDEEAEAALTADERRSIVAEHMAYAAMLRERGAHVLGEALEGRSSAAVVRPG
jgi:hypothetical protein